MYNTQNSAFYTMPAAFGTITNYFEPWYHIGAIYGETNINMYGTKNNAYLTVGISGPRVVENDGKIQSEGASNIVYSSFSYLPNWSKASAWSSLNGQGTREYTKMNSFVKTSDANLYGDENIVLFFGSKMKGEKTPKSWEPRHANPERAIYDSRGSYIGIYQGEIDVTAKIGTQLNIANGESQTEAGKLNKDGYTDNKVDGAVGIFVESGQREGIIPTKHLGVPVDVYGDKNLSTLDDDVIHNLEVGKIDIRFGKYSHNGYMMIAKKGSYVDIGKQSTNDYISVGDISKKFTDGINGENTSEADAATGTIVAYAEGKWDQADHKLVAKKADGILPDTDPSLANLQGKSSQIDIHIPLTLIAKEGIAYMAENSGKVKAEGDTTAVNHGAIIGFAKNLGTVDVDGEITAKDKFTTEAKNKFQNIGAFAVDGGTVNLNRNVDINGIGALAKGTNSVVNMNASANKIYTGKRGGLVALDGGKVNFEGGTLIHSANEADNHEDSTPIYSDDKSSINFTGATTIEISDGVLMHGEADDYEATVGTIKKYNGMQNVKVKLTGDNVTLKAYDGIEKNWDGTTPESTIVLNSLKLGAGNFDTNGHDYSIYYVNGKFNLTADMNLDDKASEFGRVVKIANEIFTVPNGKTVSSLTGKGLLMGSNKSATDNTTNKFLNKGTIDIKGGTLANGSTALNINYGTIDNKNSIKVEDGIGAYAANGSKILNDTGATVEVKKGVGLAAFSSSDNTKTGLDKLKDFGTDKKIKAGTLALTDKTLEIENNGVITVDGAASIGIYAETNDIASTGLVNSNNGLIKNNGKIIMKGQNGIGIVSKGLGNKIELTGTGNSDILTETDGIGVYAEKSEIELKNNYTVETKDRGTGIFLKNGSSLTGAGEFELKYNGSTTETATALYYENNGASLTNSKNLKVTDLVGSEKGLVGIFTKGSGDLTNTANISLDKGYGIVTEGSDIKNLGKIDIANPINLANEKSSVGIYSKTANTIENLNGEIKVGDHSVGIFGKTIKNSGKIKVGKAGTAIYSDGGNIDLLAGNIEVGTDKAAGVYLKGTNQTLTAHNGSSMNIGKDSFGIINDGTGNSVISNVTSQTLGEDNIYIYSKDRTGNITNNTKLTSTGSYNYGIYASGNVVNNGDINFNNGYGNVGVYSTHGGTATNNAKIAVGKSFIDDNNPLNNRYAVGMAAGYTPTEDEARAGKVGYTGNIVNHGVINVNDEDGIGIYGTGKGTTVYNGTATDPSGTINLNASKTTGIYLDNGAYGYNYGTIKTNGSGLQKNVGVLVRNGSTIENHGDIILDSVSAVGLLAKGDVLGNNLGIIKNYKDIIITDENSEKIKEDAGVSNLSKTMGDRKIDVPKGSGVGTITVNGIEVEPTLATTNLKTFSDMKVSKIGMYIDTSGDRFTRPISGLSKLDTLKKADLIIGAEATKNTLSQYIKLDSKIIEPYNQMIKKNPQITEWNIYSGSFTWMATVAQNQTTGRIENAYMVKRNYTEFAKDKDTTRDTYNFLDGLEQRYGVNGLNSREQELFNKITSIGNNESIVFDQAVDEMMGHQYANTQQRVKETSDILDKEFNYLRKDWQNFSKDSNKIKTFGTRGKYETNTAGVIDYTNNAYGVAYVHEDETLNLGKTSGWYAGIVDNKFNFKDIGSSKEDQLQGKIGVFKSIPFDYDNSLNLTISGDLSVGYNKMNRRFLVVDEIFGAKAKYYTYAAGLKNELSKEIRLSEDFSFKPYAQARVEYGKISKIKEKSGEMKLEVKANDYYSIKPEAGAELIFKYSFGSYKTVKAVLSAAYEKELGKIADGRNQAKVADTSAEYFNIKGEKENREGNIKTDLKVGVDNSRVGLTANVGYDTKGQNIRGGVGVRFIF